MASLEASRRPAGVDAQEGRVAQLRSRLAFAAALSVKRVVLTGASSGIGLATAQAFLGEGYEVISIARRPCPLRSERLRSVTVDLMDADATRAAVIALAAEAPATTVVHCAGAIREKPIEEASIADLAALANL